MADAPSERPPVRARDADPRGEDLGARSEHEDVGARSEHEDLGARGERQAHDDDPMFRAYARARERDALARAQLRPLAPGERPVPLVVAAVLAAAIAVANLALLAGGWDVRGGDPSTPGVLVFAGLMLAAAAGMWQRRYVAVLGFQALLGIGVAYAGLSLLVATNVTAIVLCLVIIVGGGFLFWKLVRVMARIQVASRRPGEPVS